MSAAMLEQQDAAGAQEACSGPAGRQDGRPATSSCWSGGGCGEVSTIL